MTTGSGYSWHRNPFPLIPVVRLGPSADLGDAPVTAADSGNASIATPTSDQLNRLVDDYLVENPTGGRRGRAIAVVGSFGLGKSHVLRQIYTSLSRRPDGPAMWIVDEPAQDMGRMYRDRLRGPGDTPQGRRAFEELVRDYYAYVTANRVGEQGGDPRLGSLDEIAAGLRDRSLDPGKVVSALRYDPEVIHADLRGKLGEITEHRRFATALALLQDSLFTRLVWAWLNGEEPAEALRERGITEAIVPPSGSGRPDTAAGIDQVFDALAVQGFMHGRVGSPYVLLVDALEKVLDWPQDSRRVFVDAFERLVNIYVSRGGLLIFCISAAGLQELRPSLHERLLQVWPEGFTRELTGELVAAYVEAGRRGEDEASAPFAELFGADTLRTLHEQTEGLPREILKTCSQAWLFSEDTHGAVREVTPAAVLRAVRALHEKVSRDQVAAVVHDALSLGQWRIASRDPVPARMSSPQPPDASDPAEEVVYWLAPAPKALLAVIVTRSVLGADDAERVAAYVQGLRNAVLPARFEALIVVNGHVPQHMQDRLSRLVGSPPLVYRQPDFDRKVNDALERLAGRLADGGRATELEQLGERMRRELAQQNVQLAELRQAMTSLARDTGTPEPAAATGHATEPEAPADSLPGPVARRFQETLSVLDAVTRELAAGERAARRTVTQPELSKLGCATLTRTLTEAFRSSVADWHRTPGSGAPAGDRWDELRRICREYENAVEVLPVHLLGNPGPPHPLTAARSVEVLAEEVWETLSAAAAA